jgi:predicted  nucleic acid-binding Zn-ribbon protein
MRRKENTMTRNTLIAAAILTLAPLTANAQDYDYRAMDEARRAANRHVADLTAEINTLTHRIPELEHNQELAYQTYRIRRAQFGPGDPRTLAALKDFEQKKTHKRLVERRLSQLQDVRKQRTMEFMLEEGKKHNPRWTVNILRLRYASLR